jgi:hypothetical protein
VSAGGNVAVARQFTIGRFNPTANINIGHWNCWHLWAQYKVRLRSLQGGLSVTRFGNMSDGRSAVGDLLPQASLRWNAGVHNFMAYVMGDVPVGAYDPMLANRGVGHGAVDGGVGYTYLNHQTGNEFCLVTGLTYNFKNTNTNYQNGIDWHADWGMSHFLTPQIFAVRWAISMIN